MSDKEWLCYESDKECCVIMPVVQNGCVMRVIWLSYVRDKERLCYESDMTVLCP